jgi:hypothetical protein
MKLKSQFSLFLLLKKKEDSQVASEEFARFKMA